MDDEVEHLAELDRAVEELEESVDSALCFPPRSAVGALISKLYATLSTVPHDKEPAVLTLIGRAHLAENQDASPSAEYALERALKLQPRKARSWALYAECLLRKGCGSEALAACQAALDWCADDNCELFHILLATAASCRAVGDHMAAITVSQRVVSESPSRQSYYSLALSLLMGALAGVGPVSHLCHKSLLAFNQAEQMGGGVSPDLLFNRAKARELLLDFDGALTDMEVALHHDASLPLSDLPSALALAEALLKSPLTALGGPQNVRRRFAKFPSDLSLRTLFGGDRKGSLSLVLLSGPLRTSWPRLFAAVDENGDGCLVVLVECPNDKQLCVGTVFTIASPIPVTARVGGGRVPCVMLGDSVQSSLKVDGLRVYQVDCMGGAIT